MVKGRVKITIAMTRQVMYGFSSGMRVHLTVINFEGRGQVHFRCEYLRNGDRWQTIYYYFHQTGCHVLTLVGIIKIDLDPI